MAGLGLSLAQAGYPSGYGYEGYEDSPVLGSVTYRHGAAIGNLCKQTCEVTRLEVRADGTVTGKVTTFARSCAQGHSSEKQRAVTLFDKRVDGNKARSFVNGLRDTQRAIHGHGLSTAPQFVGCRSTREIAIGVDGQAEATHVGAAAQGIWDKDIANALKILDAR